MTTIQTVTPEQIEQLRDEAGAAGDSDMAAICIVALTGDTTELEPEDGERLDVRTRESAIAACVAAINAAEAMQ